MRILNPLQCPSYILPELAGATWVRLLSIIRHIQLMNQLEHDANIPSGESFCRQFLLGQNYFQSRFGKRCDIFMLPDTCMWTYPCTLLTCSRILSSSAPDCQTIRSEELFHPEDQLERIVSSLAIGTTCGAKIVSNTFPFTTFNWVGIDGSQLLTHMTPVVNYNSNCHYDDILKGHTGNHDVDVFPQGMILFGNGDGGGGPNADMLERLRRARLVGVEHDPKGAEVPLVKVGSGMGEFFEEVRKKTRNGETLPSWWGELYLEIHRRSPAYLGSSLKLSQEE